MPDGLAELLSAIGLTRDELTGSVAVVTGAGRGIGRETARFTKDAKLLGEISNLTARRIALIERLEAALGE